MAKQVINIGTNPNDGTGEPMRVGGDKINQNFDQLFDSGSKVDVTSFEKVGGDYVNSPSSPWTLSTIPLILTNAVNGGISSIWYKGPVLTKASFTGGTIVMFSGVNVLNELCRVFIDYDKANLAFSVNIQTGFTGDLPSGVTETSPVLVITDPLTETSPVLNIV